MMGGDGSPSFLIGIAIGYGLRWLVARKKVKRDPVTGRFSK